MNRTISRRPPASTMRPRFLMQTLIRLKRVAGRPRELGRIAELEALQKEFPRERGD